jgi:hypothetical protein
MKTRTAQFWTIKTLQIRLSVGVFLLVYLLTSLNLCASELRIGTAIADITPALPVALDVQFNMRIARKVATPLTANVVALESREGNQSLDMAVMVSCDLVGIPKNVTAMVRKEVSRLLPSFDVQKIFLSAIHTHTAPVMENTEEMSWGYPIPKTGVTQPEEYCKFFSKRVAKQLQKPGTIVLLEV